MNTGKLRAFVKTLFVVGSLLVLANLPTNAELLIGISFPSQGSGDNDVFVFNSEGKPLLTSSAINNTTNGLGVSSTFSLMNPAASPVRSAEIAVITQPESLISPSTGFILFESTTIGSLTATLKQDTLQLDWPTDRIGWILQTQTNATFNSQWFPVRDSSATNHFHVTLDRANSSVFFRLVAP
jgi:hypothetical protein